MINVSIAGIGGQGSVLAARILAQAAEAKGWQGTVRAYCGNHRHGATRRGRYVSRAHGKCR